MVVKVGFRTKMGEGGEARMEMADGENGKPGRIASTEKKTTTSKLVRKYSSCVEDFNWASRGLVGTVIDGESIPLIKS